MKIKVGLVEDNPQLMVSISSNLRLFEEVELVFTATNGKEALTKLQVHAVDVVLMDIEMPVMDGVTATRQVREHHSGVKVVMLTVFDREDRIFDAILAGATGY
ncbi:MAG: response regulator transcription factor, partial [Bacteroidota bacterium]